MQLGIAGKVIIKASALITVSLQAVQRFNDSGRITVISGDRGNTSGEGQIDVSVEGINPVQNEEEHQEGGDQRHRERAHDCPNNNEQPSEA